MANTKVELSRDLSLFDITMIGVGAMIGAGIFVLTGIAAGAAGPALIVAFALNGIVAILTAMTYAEPGSAIPEAGGGYLWVKEGLPGPNTFLAGWMSWFDHAVAGSLYALGFARIRPRTPTIGFGMHQILNYVRGGFRDIEPESEASLQEQGILRPVSERYHGRLVSGVNKTPMLISALLGLIAVVLMYVGDGRANMGRFRPLFARSILVHVDIDQTIGSASINHRCPLTFFSDAPRSEICCILLCGKTS